MGTESEKGFGETLARAALEGYKGNQRLEAFERAKLPEDLETVWKRERPGIMAKANRGETEFHFEFHVHNARYYPGTEDVVAALPLELWYMRNEAERGYTVRVTGTAFNEFRIDLGVTKRASQLIRAHEETQEPEPAPKRQKRPSGTSWPRPKRKASA